MKTIDKHQKELLENHWRSPAASVVPQWIPKSFVPSANIPDSLRECRTSTRKDNQGHDSSFWGWLQLVLIERFGQTVPHDQQLRGNSLLQSVEFNLCGEVRNQRGDVSVVKDPIFLSETTATSRFLTNILVVSHSRIHLLFKNPMKS
jgi:hypothetical protein